MVDSDTLRLIRPLVFAVAALPMVIDNVRTGRITNRNNAVLFLAGIGMLVLGPVLLGVAFQRPALSLWMAVAVVPVVFFARGWIGGGAAKFLIALLPWFSSGNYLSVAGGGFVVAAVVAKLLRRGEAQVALPTVMIGLLVQAAGIAAAEWH